MSTSAKVKIASAAIAALFVLIVVGILWSGMIGHNDNQNWQVCQSINGKVSVIDTAGYYFKGFATVWTYPRSIQAYYSESTKRAARKMIRSRPPLMMAARPKSPRSSRFNCRRPRPSESCSIKTSTPTRRMSWMPCVRT